MTTATLTDADFRRFQELIYGQAGIHLAQTKRALLAGRLGRRLRALNIETYRDYLDHVASSPSELVEMFDCVTTNETRFFREEKQFEFIESALIPRWVEDADNGVRARSVNVWSAGCSTGEEPFSVAMMLTAGLGPQWGVNVFATDLSTRVLEKARAATWPVEKASQIPERLLKAFMLRGRGAQLGKMRASPDLRSRVSFGRLNLHDAAYGLEQKFDMILCRNVLIYFDQESRRAVIERLIDQLVPGGLLFIGHAETLHGVTTRVRSVRPTIYQKPFDRTPACTF